MGSIFIGQHELMPWSLCAELLPDSTDPGWAQPTTAPGQHEQEQVCRDSKVSSQQWGHIWTWILTQRVSPLCLFCLSFQPDPAPWERLVCRAVPTSPPASCSSSFDKINVFGGLQRSCWINSLHSVQHLLPGDEQQGVTLRSSVPPAEPLP